MTKSDERQSDPARARAEDLDYSREPILVVDDDENLREALRAMLATLGFPSASALSGDDAINCLTRRQFSIVLTDMIMPGMAGIELIKYIDAHFDGVSTIAMTGYSNDYSYIDVVNAGACDFIKKPFRIEELEAKIRRILTEKNLRRELNKLSITDSLTNLFNYRHFYKRLQDEIQRAARQKNPLSLILLDLNKFKEYNDTYGHLVGDEILRNAGDIINRCIRENVDCGFRYGGDEFAIILVDAGLETAKEIGGRISSAFKESAGITVSMGFSVFSTGMTPQDLVSQADMELYRMKIVPFG